MVGFHLWWGSLTIITYEDDNEEYISQSPCHFHPCVCRFWCERRQYW